MQSLGYSEQGSLVQSNLANTHVFLLPLMGDLAFIQSSLEGMKMAWRSWWVELDTAD